MTKLLRTPDDIVAALRARKEALDISNETVDGIAQWADGYAGKLLCPEPMKGLGRLSLPSLLEALGVALVLVEDSAAAVRVRDKWVPRKRPQRKLPPEAPCATVAVVDDVRPGRSRNPDNGIATSQWCVAGIGDIPDIAVIGDSDVNKTEHVVPG
jgi:hypothetical protein